MEIHELAATVETKEDLIQFLYAFESDLQTNSGAWENIRLDHFLEACARWLEDSSAPNLVYPAAKSPDNASWRLFADILMAGRTYE